MTAVDHTVAAAVRRAQDEIRKPGAAMAMTYEFRRPNTEAEAIAIISSAFSVLRQQLEFIQGKRRRAWGGDYVDHVSNEATHAIAWLADRYPQLTAAIDVEPPSTFQG